MEFPPFFAFACCWAAVLHFQWSSLCHNHWKFRCNVIKEDPLISSLEAFTLVLSAPGSVMTCLDRMANRAGKDFWLKSHAQRGDDKTLSHSRWSPVSFCLTWPHFSILSSRHLQSLRGQNSCMRSLLEYFSFISFLLIGAVSTVNYVSSPLIMHRALTFIL